MAKTISTLAALALSAATNCLLPSNAQAQTTGCETNDLLGRPVQYAAVPETIPLSCDAGPSTVIYTGGKRDGTGITLRCAWKLDENGNPVVDTSYREIDTRNDRTQDARRIQFSDGVYIATKATDLHGQSPFVSAVLEAFDPQLNVLGTKACEVGADTAPLDQCKTAASFVTTASLQTDQRTADQCQAYVKLLAEGGSITAGYYNPSDKLAWKQSVKARLGTLAK